MTKERGRFFTQLERFLARRLNGRSRILIVLACVALAFTFVFPIWHINLVAPQYRDGLDMWIYSYQLVGGREGQDIVEINLLNHYIGMAEVHEADFWEMQFLPFAFGFFILFGLRVAVFGRIGNVVDHLVLFLYFSLFSLGAFVYRLYDYSHNLDPQAPMTIDPFWPTIIGTKQIANMTQTSLPGLSSYLILVSVVCLILAIYFSRNEAPYYEAQARLS